MTALLTADEAARLVPGETLVIVRAGDVDPATFSTFGGAFVAPQDWVAITGPCPTCDGSGFDITPEKVGVAFVKAMEQRGVGVDHLRCPDCHEGRRIVPLYTECPDCGGSTWIWEPMERWDSPGRQQCAICSDGRVLVGRATIRIVPVLHWSDNDEEAPPCISVGHTSPPGANSYLCLQRFGGHPLNFDPLPVPGRDWGIVIDCVEVA